MNHASLYKASQYSVQHQESKINLNNKFWTQSAPINQHVAKVPLYKYW